MLGPRMNQVYGLMADCRPSYVKHACTNSDALSVAPVQAVAREQCNPPVSGYTPQGGVVVIANQLGLVGRLLVNLRNELQVSDRHPDSFVVNAYVASAATGLQSIGDAVATFCQHHAPDDTISGYVNFSKYPFGMLKFEFVSTIKKQIDLLTYDNKMFDQLANFLKHEQPFLVVSQVEYLHDLYDANSTGVLRGMLIPVYEFMKQILHRLGQTYGVKLQFPDV